MRIISKYILKEHLGPLVFALSALTSLLLLNYVAKQFDKLVGKGLSWTVIGEFFLLSIPFTVAMTLPMAVLVSTLYAFSRLAAENEVTALKASGISLVRVLAPVLVGATMIAGLMVWFNDQVLPRANHQLSILQQDIARKKPTFALRERVMNELSPGRTFLRTNHLDPATNKMREIEIVDLSNPLGKRTIHADSGIMEFSEGQVDLYLILYDGYLQEIPTREQGQFQRHFFEKNRIRVAGVGNELTRSESGGFKGDREMSICEMQAQVNQAYSELATHRTTLSDLLAGEVRAALTGADQEQEPKPAIRDKKGGLGDAYCGFVAQLTGRGDEEEAEEPITPSDEPERVSPSGASAAESGQGSEARSSMARSDMLADASGESVVMTTPRRQGIPPSAGRPFPTRGLQAPRGAIRDQGIDAGQASSDSAAAAASPIRPIDLPKQMSTNYRRPRSASIVSGQIEAQRAQMEMARQTMQRYDVEIQKKFALAAACVVFVLLGAPVALRFPRGGVGMTLGVSLVVFAIYYIGLIGGEALADRGMLTPFWAMWAANVIFTIVGLVLLARMGREGATSRGGDFGELRDQARAWLARQARRIGIPLDRRRSRA